jgi:hypothetical protein
MSEKDFAMAAEGKKCSRRLQPAPVFLSIYKRSEKVI